MWGMNTNARDYVPLGVKITKVLITHLGKFLICQQIKAITHSQIENLTGLAERTELRS